MYKIVFQGGSREELNNFINSILSKNLSLFDDSGIDDVAFIEDNYIRNSEILRKKILSEVLKHASYDIIGKMSSEKGMFFSIQIASFRIFIHYFEDTSSKIRYIHSLEFYRK